MGNKNIERIKYWLQLFLVPIYGLSFLFPRNKDIWLFGSDFGKRFSDNSRYLYLYTSQNEKENVKAIWISHEKKIVRFLKENNYEAFYYHSLRGIWYSLRGGVYIFNNYTKDIDFWLSGGAVKINLWHGSGNKRTNYDNAFDKVRHPKNAWEKWKTWLRRLSDEKPGHYTLATSDDMAEIFISAFQTERSHILLEGYPRNDVLFPQGESRIGNLLTEKEAQLLCKAHLYKREGYTLLAYMPTFRDSETVFFDIMNLELFNDYLYKSKRILITKLHPKSKLKDAFQRLQFSNILNADSEIDIYSFLREIDLLVTDYSSVYTDFMLLDKPVVAFQYDWEIYTMNTRESYIPHDEYMPEKKARTMWELMDAIDCVLWDDSCKSKRQKSRNRMFKKIDGKSASRLYIKILKLISEEHI